MLVEILTPNGGTFVDLDRIYGHGIGEKLENFKGREGLD